MTVFSDRRADLHVTVGKTRFVTKKLENVQRKVVQLATKATIVRKVKTNNPITNIVVDIISECGVIFTECDTMTFGRNCSQTCHCSNNEPCNKINGYCTSDCASGWIGNDCQTRA